MAQSGRLTTARDALLLRCCDDGGIDRDGGNRLCGWMERRYTKGVDDGQSQNKYRSAPVL